MLSESHIRKAIAEFDPNQINMVKVSRRDGKNYVWDGQHTVTIVQTVSGSDETPVWCMIYSDLEYTEEAHLFAEQKKHVKPLTPYEIFAAHIEAQEPKQELIKEICGSYGLKITGNKIPENHVCAVATLEKIYDEFGQEVLSRTLRLAVGTWEGAKNSLSATMLMAIAKMVVAYGDKMRDDIFKENVGLLSVNQIIRSGKERRPGALGYAYAMIDAYNGKRKSNRLDPHGLFGGKKTIRDVPETAGNETEERSEIRETEDHE